MTSREGAGFERLPPGHRQALPDSRRATLDELHREIELVSHNPVVTAVLGIADALLIVLNAQRQIVAFNGRVAAIRGASDVSGVLGLRPGEALDCVNSQGPGGCGASAACETCGALGAILACQRNRRSAEAECLLRTSSRALEFNVRATPIVLGDRPFTVLSLRDISGEKRRQALEQIFFHDVLNTVTALRSWTALLRHPGANHQRAGERIDLVSRQLEREIQDQRALALAESGTLVAKPLRVRAADLLGDLDVMFASHFAAEGRRLELEEGQQGLELETDPSIALRVLGNMVRNALEATEPGGTVRVRCECTSPVDGGPPRALRFGVWSHVFIPPEIQAHVFQRSFSTKAECGRGLGTYSMKLLGEGYLGGKVSFVSEVDSGTVFSLELPVEFPRSGARH
jgi:signal transduction histidine kinase